MNLTEKLTEIGLSQKQAKIYLACLQLGIDTVLNIAKYAHIKRPSAYLILDDLEKLGLVSRVQEKNKTLFKAEAPAILMAELELKKEITSNILPSLQAIYNLDPQKPTIKIGEGIIAVRNIYNSIFQHLNENPDDELLIYGSLKDAQLHFSSLVLDIFYRSMSQSKNMIREIGNDDHETRKYYRKANKINPRHEIKLIRREGEFEKTDNMIYGNSMVIFSVQEQIFAITIESPHIVNTYKVLFEMAWRSGKPI